MWQSSDIEFPVGKDVDKKAKDITSLADLGIQPEDEADRAEEEEEDKENAALVAELDDKGND